MSENLVEMVELAEGDDPTTFEPADTTSAGFIHAASRSPNLSRATLPFAALVFLARVQKLEARMATLLHHM